MSPWLAVYQALFPAVGVAVAAKMLLGGRGRTLREGFSDLRERLGTPPPYLLKESLWIHAASVGEMTGAAALRHALHGRRSFVTASTVAGRDAAGKLTQGAASLAPMDLLPCVRRFLDATSPRALIVMETELWPATLAACAERGVPFGIANARLSERSFPRYRLIKPLLGPLLSRTAAVAAQTDADAERFALLGVPRDRLQVTGNLKFDAAPPEFGTVAGIHVLFYEHLGWKPGNEPVFCAGSTRPGPEEHAVLEAFLRLKPTFPDLRLVLAPRHIERCAEVAAELERRGVSFCTVSRPARGRDCLLVDVLGRLRAFYAASDLAFVGGTLGGVGGHNVLEPAAAGVPVLFGPSTESIREPAEALERAGGIRVRDGAELEARVRELLADPRKREIIARLAKGTAERFMGASRRTAEFLLERLRL